jgi:hypothetical protein
MVERLHRKNFQEAEEINHETARLIYDSFNNSPYLYLCYCITLTDEQALSDLLSDLLTAPHGNWTQAVLEMEI